MYRITVLFPLLFTKSIAESAPFENVQVISSHLFHNFDSLCLDITFSRHKANHKVKCDSEGSSHVERAISPIDELMIVQL